MQELSDERKSFLEILEIEQRALYAHEKRLGVTLSYVGMVLRAFQITRQAYGYVKLEDVPQQLFRDVLEVLCNYHYFHSDFNKTDFARATDYSRATISNWVSRTPAGRTRSWIPPQRYQTLLRIFAYPKRYTSPTGCYGQWNRAVYR